MKKVKAGGTLSIRLPVKTDAEIINYLNDEKKLENRNKYLTSIILAKIEEDMQEEKDTITLSIPTSLDQQQKQQIKENLESLLKMMTGQNQPVQEETGSHDTNQEEEDFGDWAGCVEF